MMGIVVVDGSTVYSDLSDGSIRAEVLSKANGYVVKLGGMFDEKDAGEDPYRILLDRIDNKHLSGALRSR